ncbi:Spiroplasmavirus-related protein [Spiroplasma kunkelii CR2-3x]|uniref:Spiroplasmavirus-related protein n=1 Tax=Spiroplasma kunkelii CR2-3x TaxID=273035 RepID=A0A0K2JIP3_SPIKU|nr:hypothetical protein [Spiroplasma kunkelii]ALA98465.1 Spiroplasmavirus-related protein [Spiroplasma kunkelii CR2-3x]
MRDLKNDEIVNKKEYYWSEITKLSVKEQLELFDIDILKNNLKPKKRKEIVKMINLLVENNNSNLVNHKSKILFYDILFSKRQVLY